MNFTDTTQGSQSFAGSRQTSPVQQELGNSLIRDLRVNILNHPSNMKLWKELQASLTDNSEISDTRLSADAGKTHKTTAPSLLKDHPPNPVAHVVDLSWARQILSEIDQLTANEDFINVLSLIDYHAHVHDRLKDVLSIKRAEVYVRMGQIDKASLALDDIDESNVDYLRRKLFYKSLLYLRDGGAQSALEMLNSTINLKESLLRLNDITVTTYVSSLAFFACHHELVLETLDLFLIQCQDSLTLNSSLRAYVPSTSLIKATQLQEIEKLDDNPTMKNCLLLYFSLLNQESQVLSRISTEYIASYFGDHPLLSDLEMRALQLSIASLCQGPCSDIDVFYSILGKAYSAVKDDHSIVQFCLNLIANREDPVWKLVGPQPSNSSVSSGSTRLKYQFRSQSGVDPRFISQCMSEMSAISALSLAQDPDISSVNIPPVINECGIDLSGKQYAGECFLRFLQECRCLAPPGGFDRVFLLPWLKTGGADKVAIDWINFCGQLDGKQSLVILNEPSDSEWLGKLSPFSCAVRSAPIIGNLTVEDQAYAVALAIQYISPRIVHNINSNLGYVMAQRHANFLRNHTSLACHIFCNDKDAFGNWDGYPARHSKVILENFKYVFSDNETFLKETFSDYSQIAECRKLTEQVIGSIYVPHYGEPGQAVQAEVKNKILWAGRLDAQKRPDRLAEIARLMPDVEFHIYGYSLFQQKNDYNTTLSLLDNVRVFGRYDSFYEIPVHDYDAYLLTSDWEGIPNTIIEAARCRLPIVSPTVGGIAEILSLENGFPVAINAPADQYVQSLRFILANKKDALTRSQRLYDLIVRTHSFHAMERKLYETGYLVHGRQG